MFHLQFTRDWFLKRFRLLANDILVDQERANRKFKLDNMRILNENEISKVHDLEALLIRGVQVQYTRIYITKIE